MPNNRRPYKAPNGLTYAATTRQTWRGVETSLDRGTTYHPTPAAAFQRTPTAARVILPARPPFDAGPTTTQTRRAHP